MGITLKVPTIFSAIDKMSPTLGKMRSNVSSFAQKVAASGERGQRFFRNLGQGADGLFGKIINLKNAAVALAGGLVVGKGIQMFKEVVDIGDALGETAQRIGINVVKLQELQYAAQKHNVSADSLTNSIGKLNKNFGDLQRGSGALYAAFRKSDPGFLKQLKNTKDTSVAFDMAMSYINKMPTAMKKASAAQLFFGKSGQEMVNLLGDGPEALKALQKEAGKFGGVLSEEAVKAMMDFDDKQDEMNAAIFGLKANIVTGLLPIVGDLISKLTNWIASHKDLIKSKVEDFVKKLSNGVKWLSDHIDAIKTGLTWLIGALIVLKTVSLAAALITNTLTIATNLWSAAQWLLNSALLASPITWIIIGIIALIAIIILVVKHVRGWGEQWDSILKWMKAVLSVWVLGVKLYFQGLYLGFMTMVEGIVLAWKWGQNLIGALSDEQYARDKDRIKEEQKMRVMAIKQTAIDLKNAMREAAAGPELKLRLKSDDEAAAGPESSGSKFPLVNSRKAQNDAFVDKMTSVQKQQVELTIKDNSGKAEVTKNTGNIPIKTSPTIASFGN